MTKVDSQTNTKTNKNYKHTIMIKTDIHDKGRQDIQRQRLTKMTITKNPHLPTIRCRRSKLGAIVGCIPLTNRKDSLYIVENSSGSLLGYI